MNENKSPFKFYRYRGELRYLTKNIIFVSNVLQLKPRLYNQSFFFNNRVQQLTVNEIL